MAMKYHQLLSHTRFGMMLEHVFLGTKAGGWGERSNYATVNVII